MLLVDRTGTKRLQDSTRESCLCLFVPYGNVGAPRQDVTAALHDRTSPYMYLCRIHMSQFSVVRSSPGCVGTPYRMCQALHDRMSPYMFLGRMHMSQLLRSQSIRCRFLQEVAWRSMTGCRHVCSSEDTYVAVCVRTVVGHVDAPYRIPSGAP